jgi:predicted XRE-type DNA-binding protein
MAIISTEEKGKMKKAKKTTRAQKSSGNVFDDLGLSDPQDRLAKAQLAHRICQIVGERRLTQANAAELMRLDQPKISALMRGKLKGYSVERLCRCLNDLGQEIEISIRPGPKVAGHRCDTRVVVAACG